MGVHEQDPHLPELTSDLFVVITLNILGNPQDRNDGSLVLCVLAVTMGLHFVCCIPSLVVYGSKHLGVRCSTRKAKQGLVSALILRSRGGRGMYQRVWDRYSQRITFGNGRTFPRRQTSEKEKATSTENSHAPL